MHFDGYPSRTVSSEIGRGICEKSGVDATSPSGKYSELRSREYGEFGLFIDCCRIRNSWDGVRSEANDDIQSNTEDNIGTLNEYSVGICYIF
jgi:hypothetical protein